MPSSLTVVATVIGGAATAVLSAEQGRLRRRIRRRAARVSPAAPARTSELFRGPRLGCSWWLVVLLRRLRRGPGGRMGSGVPPGLGRGMAALAAGCGLGLLLRGAAGLVAGGVVAAVAYRRLPQPPSPEQRAARAERTALGAQLPLTADLLAACLAASSAPAAAAEAVAEAVGPPMGGRLATLAAELRLGADPADSWSRFGEPPELAPLARCLARACESGAPPAAVLARLADAQRSAAARAAQARVRRAGVLATAPLGLCFLPAFVLTGVVPTVVGLAAHFLTHL
jgi:Flp pilus assembly protein TadB